MHLHAARIGFSIHDMISFLKHAGTCHLGVASTVMT